MPRFCNLHCKIFRMKIALCNIPIRWEQPEANIELCSSTCKSVKESDSKVELLLFPEFFTYGFGVNSTKYEDKEGESLKSLQRLAIQYDFAIYASVPVKDGANIYNRGYFVKPDGTYNFYDKRHLFSYGGEDLFFTRGKKRVIVNYKEWKILLQLCYDLRFPVWSRNIENDNDLIINIASWPSVRSNVIKTLASARAIENQSYYAFLNRSGSDLDINYSGESFVFSCDGTPINHTIANIDSNYSIFDLDKASLLSFRAKFPVWRDSDKFKILY